MFLTAARFGNLEILKYLHENGCPWYSDTCSSAADGGHLMCLTYAHEHGCKWEEDTCSFAAKKGHIKCLKYAHENNCIWYRIFITCFVTLNHSLQDFFSLF